MKGSLNIWTGGGGGSGDLLAANNLSDLADAATARTNLGLGPAALLDASEGGNGAGDAGKLVTFDALGNITASDFTSLGAFFGDGTNLTGVAVLNAANAFTAANTITTSGLGTTPTAGLSLINATAAAAGAQQVSPSFRQTAQGWKTNATAASQTVYFESYVLPVQGSANPSAFLKFGASINGGALSEVFKMHSSGKVGWLNDATTEGGWMANAPSIGVYFGREGQSTNPLALIGYTGGAELGGVKIGSNLTFSWNSNSTLQAGSVDLILARKAAATLQMGVDAAGVTNQMFTAASRITSDGVGANLTIAGGNGRGGAGGSLILSTYTTGAAATAGTLTTRLTLDTAGLLTFADAVDMAFNTTTGSKFGTATTQKMGWWNATPVVQPAHIADPAGGAVVDAEARPAINAILAWQATLGLTAAA